MESCKTDQTRDLQFYFPPPISSPTLIAYMRIKAPTRSVIVLALLLSGLRCDSPTSGEEDPHFGMVFTWHFWQINVPTGDTALRFTYDVTADFLKQS